MKAIGYIATTIGLIVYSTLLGGWALAKLWLWFIAPTFGLPALSVAAAIGISMVVAYLTHRMDDTKSDSDDPYWMSMLKLFGYSTLKPLLSLLLGSIVRHWL